jgi:hypothetical protein
MEIQTAYWIFFGLIVLIVANSCGLRRTNRFLHQLQKFNQNQIALSGMDRTLKHNIRVKVKEDPVDWPYKSIKGKYFHVAYGSRNKLILETPYGRVIMWDNQLEVPAQHTEIAWGRKKPS